MPIVATDLCRSRGIRPSEETVRPLCRAGIGSKRVRSPSEPEGSGIFTGTNGLFSHASS